MKPTLYPFHVFPYLAAFCVRVEEEEEYSHEQVVGSPSLGPPFEQKLSHITVGRRCPFSPSPRHASSASPHQLQTLLFSTFHARMRDKSKISCFPISPYEPVSSSNLDPPLEHLPYLQVDPLPPSLKSTLYSSRCIPRSRCLCGEKRRRSTPMRRKWGCRRGWTYLGTEVAQEEDMKLGIRLRSICLSHCLV